MPWVADKRDARKQQVLAYLRSECGPRGGLVWLSSRLLAQDKLYRSNSETLSIVRELVAEGKLCRVSAPGRGRGKGRTLYWTPGTAKTKVMRELVREQMPDRVLLAALRFFVRRKNAPDGERQQSLRSSTFGTEMKKDARARAPNVFPAPSGPPGPRRTLSPAPSTTPSLGRLPSHGRLQRLAVLLPRITDDPATHLADCECSVCSSRRVTRDDTRDR